jgi:hypothetical protein
VLGEEFRDDGVSGVSKSCQATLDLEVGTVRAPTVADLASITSCYWAEAACRTVLVSLL